MTDLRAALNAAAEVLRQSALTEAAVLQAVTEQLARLKLRGGVALLDEAGELLAVRAVAFPGPTLAALEKLTGQRAVGFTFPLDRVEAYHQALATRRAVFAPDSGVIVAQILSPALRKFAEQILPALGRAPAIIAPLVEAGQALGVLSIVGRNISPADIPAVTTLADHIAVALVNARLLTAERQRASQLAALYAIGRVATQTLALEETLHQALDHVLNLLQVEAGGILLLEPDGRTLTLHVQRGFPPEFLQNVHSVKLGEGLAGQAAATRAPLAMAVSDYPLERLAPFIIKAGFQSLASVPLIGRGRVVGALNLATREVSRFQVETLDFLAAVGEQLGSAIVNAQLYETAQRRIRRLNTVNRVATALNNAYSLETALRIALTETLAALELPAGWISLRDGEQFWLAAHHNLPPALAAEDFAAMRWQPCRCQQRLLDGELPEAVNILNCERLERATGDKGGLALHASVPIRAEGEQAFGLLNVAAPPDATHFSEGELALLSAVGQQLAIAIARAHFHAETVKALAREQRLNEVARLISSALDLATILQRVAELAAELVGAEAGALALVAPDGQTITHPYFFNLPASLRLKVQPKGVGLAWRIVESGETVHLLDYSLHPEALPEWAAAGVHGCLGAPVVAGEARLGALGLFMLSPARQFAERDRALAEAVGRQAGTAIQNARLFEATQRQVEELTVLHAVATAGVEETNEDALIERATRVIGETLYTDNFGVLLLDEAAGLLRVHPSYRGVRPEVRQLTFPLGHGIAGTVAARGEPWRISDVTREPEYLDVNPEMRSELCAPLKVGRRVIGVINAESARLDAFTEADERLLATFAGQLATAIDEVRLFEETRHRAEELEALAELSTALRAARAIEEMIPIFLRKAIEAVDAASGGIFLVEPETGDLVMRGCHPLDLDLVGLRHRPGEGITGHVAATGEIHISEDLAQDPLAHILPDEAKGVSTVRSNIALPLRTQERIVGVMHVGLSEQRGFTAEQVSLLTAISEMAGNALHRARTHEELQESYLQTVLALANAMDARDAYTGDHSQRLADWAAATARELGCNEDEIGAIRWGALLHDIGKIAVPDAVLRKPGPLTQDEWAAIKNHPTTGAEIVAPVARLADVAPLIRAHQEKCDGSGYPDGLQGEEIPLGARILAVVDAYGAITDDRVYRKARSQEEAEAELQRCAGTHFDPQVVEAFLRIRGGDA